MAPNFTSNGLNTFDLLGDLTPSQRSLTRIFLRNSDLTEDALYKIVSELPEEKRMNREELKEAVEVLVEKGWIFEVKGSGQKTYTIKQQKHR